MYDFNFFESLSKKSKQQDASNRSLLGLIVFLVILLAVWPLFNLGYTYKLGKDIVSLETQVTQNEKYPLLEQADALSDYITERKGQLAVLKKTDGEIKNNEWLNEALVYNLLSTAPKDLRFSKLAVTQGKKIQIAGSASNKPAIAELVRSLRDSGRYEVLFVQSIANNEGIYNFTMNLMLKDVSKDAVD